MPLWARICLDAHRSAEYRLARERSSPLRRKATDTLEVSNPRRAVHSPENGELPPQLGRFGGPRQPSTSAQDRQLWRWFPNVGRSNAPSQLASVQGPAACVFSIVPSASSFMRTHLAVETTWVSMQLQSPPAAG